MRTAIAITAILCLPSAVFADLNVGDKVPAFKSTDDQGKEWKSADHVGKKVLVVYFYPADMTGGCTTQACGFRDDAAAMEKLGVEVVGVSGDSAENHRVFKKAHTLGFTLLADEKGEVAKAFGVPTKAGGSIERLVDGQNLTLTRGVTAARWTFVIDQDGKVVLKNTEVKPAEDSKAIRQAVEKLNGGSAEASAK